MLCSTLTTISVRRKKIVSCRNQRFRRFDGTLHAFLRKPAYKILLAFLYMRTPKITRTQALNYECSTISSRSRLFTWVVLECFSSIPTHSDYLRPSYSKANFESNETEFLQMILQTPKHSCTHVCTAYTSEAVHKVLTTVAALWLVAGRPKTACEPDS